MTTDDTLHTTLPPRDEDGEYPYADLYLASDPEVIPEGNPLRDMKCLVCEIKAGSFPVMLHTVVYADSIAQPEWFPPALVGVTHISHPIPEPSYISHRLFGDWKRAEVSRFAERLDRVLTKPMGEPFHLQLPSGVWHVQKVDDE